jgi:hypothetical protein
VLGQTTAASERGSSLPRSKTGSAPSDESSDRKKVLPSLNSQIEGNNKKNSEKLPDQLASLEKQVSHSSDSKAAEAVPPATTVMPPQKSEDYFAHLEQYGQEFLQALQMEGFDPSEETRERLHKLAKQYELVGADVADIERKKLVGLYLTSKPPAPPSVPVPPTVPPRVEESTYDAQLTPAFEELEGSLKAGDFKAADFATFEILLQLINPPPAQFWLDEDSLRKFSPNSQHKKAIQEIDRFWRKYSNERLGFSQQLEFYGFDNIPMQAKALDKQRSENKRQTIAFSKNVGWWINVLEFYKFYDQLNFTAEAPTGHLPALWFWKIPRQQVFQYGGLGILEERGGCRVDAFTLPAFMYMLKICGIKPHS